MQFNDLGFSNQFRKEELSTQLEDINLQQSMVWQAEIYKCKQFQRKCRSLLAGYGKISNKNVKVQRFVDAVAAINEYLQAVISRFCHVYQFIVYAGQLSEK